jgi:hypothetical protein
MSKKPVVEHNYNRKKDRFEITFKHFSLKKKKSRKKLIENLLGTLDRKSVRGKRRDPIKKTRLEEVGD